MAMKASVRRGSCFASLVLMATLAVGPAHAESPGKEPHPTADAQAAPLNEARTRFNRAVELYRDGDLPGALAEFRRADALAPSYRLKYNIGQVCEEQHDYACALAAFRAYLDGGGSDIPRARRTSVELDLRRIAAFVARLTVSVDVAGAEVSVDDVVVGSAPLVAPLQVNAGLRRVTARRAGLVSARSVEVAGGQEVQLELVLRPEAPAAPEQTSAPSSTGDSERALSSPSSRQLFWLSWVATGVFASGTVVSGAMALHASHQLASERQAVPTSADTLAASSSRVAHWALAADILGLLTLGSAACAVHFTLAPGASTARPAAAVLSISSRF